MWNNVNCRRYGKAKSTTAKIIARTVIIHVSYIKSVNIRIIINNFTVHKTSKLSKHSTACKCVNWCRILNSIFCREEDGSLHRHSEYGLNWGVLYCHSNSLPIHFTLGELLWQHNNSPNLVQCDMNWGSCSVVTLQEACMLKSIWGRLRSHGGLDGTEIVTTKTTVVVS